MSRLALYHNGDRYISSIEDGNEYIITNMAHGDMWVSFLGSNIASDQTIYFYRNRLSVGDIIKIEVIEQNLNETNPVSEGIESSSNTEVSQINYLRGFEVHFRHEIYNISMQEEGSCGIMTGKRFQNLFVDIEGMDRRLTYHRWLHAQDLNIGDVITIEVKELDSISIPAFRKKIVCGSTQ